MLYDKNCPLKEVKALSKLNQPWMKKGLQNACKKKNTLYREFIKLRTTESEHKYKKYKKKLISILRKSKKEYYNSWLVNNKNNTREIWKILNNVIKNNICQDNYPNYFIIDNKDNYNIKDVADHFNNFFEKKSL